MIQAVALVPSHATPTTNWWPNAYTFTHYNDYPTLIKYQMMHSWLHLCKCFITKCAHPDYKATKLWWPRSFNGSKNGPCGSTRFVQLPPSLPLPRLSFWQSDSRICFHCHWRWPDPISWHNVLLLYWWNVVRICSSSRDMYQIAYQCLLVIKTLAKSSNLGKEQGVVKSNRLCGKREQRKEQEPTDLSKTQWTRSYIRRQVYLHKHGIELTGVDVDHHHMT